MINVCFISWNNLKNRLGLGRLKADVINNRLKIVGGYEKGFLLDCQYHPKKDTIFIATNKVGDEEMYEILMDDVRFQNNSINEPILRKK